jgi:myo-inositol-1(or 4)-monophosphatase
MTPDPGSLLPVAFAAATIASDMMCTQRPVSVTEKHDRDLVSDVDLAIERQVRAHLADATPGIGFLGEEEGPSGSTASGWLWTLDPIDGTSNFAHGIPLCATSLALLHDGRPVLAVIDAPLLGQRYHAIEGQGAYTEHGRISASTTTRLRDAIVAVGDYATGPQADRKNELRLALTVQLAPRVHRVRMLGTAALDLAWVAEGRLDASITLGNIPWDTSAGVLLAREAGATVVDTDGSAHGFSSAATIAGPTSLISQLLPLIQATEPSDTPAQDTQRTHPSPYAGLDTILHRARHLIFDFDGSICDLTAAMPTDTADRMRTLMPPEAANSLRQQGGSSGPFAILTAATGLSPDLGARLDAELTSIELAAATHATPAGYVHEALAACRDSGRTITVISRRSADAVSAYLAKHGLSEQIRHVIAPASYPPGHLQTEPHLLEDAIHALATTPADCALITASPAGIQAALNIGAQPIGYAATPADRQRLADIGAACVIPSLADLTLRLRARPLPN